MSQTMVGTQTQVASAPMATTTANPRETLLLSLKGQTARIPNLKPVFADWRGIPSRHISPWVEPLRQKVNTRLQGFNFSQGKQKRLAASDFASFTALWWPDAPLEKLEVLAYLVIWLFTWDDEIDEPSGMYSTDFSAAQGYRERTLHFVGTCLGLIPDDKGAGPQNEIVKSFDVIGSALRESYDVGQCQRFYDEIARFMAASEEEQAGRLMGKIPSLEEYWRFRLGTSAVYIGSAAGEYSISSRIPQQVMRTQPMQAIWDETNAIISITNDLLSLRKEMKLDCIDSIVPLAFTTTNDVSTAIAESVAAMRASKGRFDAAAQMLLAQSYQNEEMRKQVQDFVAVQRSNCVGNLVWRYSMGELMGEDGSQTFIL